MSRLCHYLALTPFFTYIYDSGNAPTPGAAAPGESSLALTAAAPATGGGAATCDGNGNLKTYDGWTYYYDAMNRLTSARSASGASADFWYDGQNRVCTWQVNGSANARFNAWDGWNLLAEYKAGGVLENEYLHGAGSDELIAMSRGVETYYFFQDGRGNTSHLTNSAGQLVERYEYDAQGAPLVYPPAPGATPRAVSVVRQLFQGQQWLGELGLANYRNRFYHPDLGRFLQPDPIGFKGDSSNLYRYCGNDSVNRNDPDGLDPNAVASQKARTLNQPDYTWTMAKFFDGANMGQGTLRGKIDGFIMAQMQAERQNSRNQAAAGSDPKLDVRKFIPRKDLTIKGKYRDEHAYQLSTSEGKRLAGHDYSVAENTRILSKSTNVDVRTTDGEFYDLPVNGLFRDGIGPLSKPSKNQNGILILEQTFELRYKGIEVPISTVLRHETRIYNEEVSNTVTVTTP